MLPEIPPRSRLDSLEPVGLGTPYVECLTGFIARLAEAHNVSTGILFGYELAPLVGKEYLRRAAIRSKYQCRILASAFRPLARAMNGAGTGACEWVKLLEKLTLRTELRFLTMLSWKEVLPQGQLLRPARAWCPACYEEWHESGKTVYEPLLWAIKAVTFCPRHRQPLRTYCSHCRKSLHLLSSRSRPGYCSACGKWLGEAVNVNSGKTSVSEETVRQVWAAEAVGEILAVAPGLEYPPSRENVLKSLNDQLKTHVGKMPALAQSLRVNSTTIWQWYKGKHLLQLGSLLKLCYQLEVSLLDFLTGKIVRNSLVVASPSQDEKDAKHSARPRRALNKLEAEQILQAALEETPPPPLQGVAARLGRDANTLRYWFRDLCQDITARYAEYKKSCSSQAWKEVEDVLQRILNDDEERPSMAQVATRLGYDVKTLTKRYPDLCQAISARHAGFHKIRWEKIQATLEAALAEYPPPSVLKLAGRLELSKSSLYEHFPSLCHQLAKRYVSCRRGDLVDVQQTILCLN